MRWKKGESLLKRTAGTAVAVMTALTVMGAAGSTGKQRVAILPLTTPKNQPDLEQYGLGTMDTLIQALANVPQFVMIDRGRIEMILKEQQFGSGGNVDQKAAVAIGKLVGAQVLVTGNLIKAGDKVRITAHFTDMKTGQITRSEVVTGTLDQIFDLMDQLAQKFIASEGITLTTQEQQRVTNVTKATSSVNAYDYYLKGRNAYLVATVESWQEAVTNYQKAIEVDPKYALAYAGLGEVYSSWGWQKETNSQDAKPMYEKSLENSQKAIELNPTLAEAHQALGHTFQNMGRFKEAEVETRKALEINPNYAEAYYTLWKLTDPDNPDNENIRKALELKPDLVTARNDLGIAYDNKGDLDSAIREYEYVLKLVPRKANTHFNIGLVYRKKKMWDEAFDHFKQAADITPDDPDAHYQVALIYRMRNLDEQAISSFKVAVRLKPNYIYAHYYLSLVYLKKQQYDDALEAMLTARSLKDDDSDIHYFIGVIYNRMKQPDKALSSFETAAGVNPKDPDIFINIGNIYLDKDELTKALEYYKKTLVLKPDYANAYYNVGLVMARMGKNSAAAEAYEDYLKYAPNADDAAAVRAKIQKLRSGA